MGFSKISVSPYVQRTYRAGGRPCEKMRGVNTPRHIAGHSMSPSSSRHPHSQ